MSRLTMRRLTPELLDVLPATDRRAIGSRRDLAWLNWIMRHDAIMAGALRAGARTPPRAILELGAGDGTFMLRVARRLAPVWPGVGVTLVDQQDLVSPATRAGFANLGWRIEAIRANVIDILSAASPGRYDAITANLFLHHFEGAALRSLLAAAARRTGLFAAAEPRRAALALAGSRMIWALGCNAVSQHDARVSVEAGFKDRELSDAWGPGESWSFSERRVGPFTHLFSARCEVT
jgi:hypothetical protein